MSDRLTTTEDHMQRLTLYEALREMNRAAADLLDSDVSTEQYRESRLRVRAACQRASDVIAQEQALRLREQEPAPKCDEPALYTTCDGRSVCTYHANLWDHASVHHDSWAIAKPNPERKCDGGAS